MENCYRNTPVKGVDPIIMLSFGRKTVLQHRFFVALIVLAGLMVPVIGQDKPATTEKSTKPALETPATTPEPMKPAEKPAGDQTVLKWNLQNTKPFFQTMTTTTNQDMQVMGSDIKQVQSQTFYFSWTPEAADKDGNWTVKQKIEGVKMSIDIGGNKISYDSTSPAGQANPLAEFFKALVGSEFKIVLDKNLKVQKVEGREEFLKKLTQTNPAMEGLLKEILSDNALKEMANPTFAALPPNGEAKLDAPWKRDSKLEMGPIGTYDNQYEYTYKGKDKDKNLDKIDVKMSLKYTPPAAAAHNALPFRIKSADLKCTDAKGTILFDPSKGRIEKSDMSLELTGKLQIEIGGQTTDVSLTQKQDTSVTTSDTNPIEPKKAG